MKTLRLHSLPNLLLSLSILLLVILSSCSSGETSVITPKTKDSLLVDHHVHLTSPELLKEWKAMNIPLSSPDFAYSNIDSILSFNPADKIFLISMGYLYSLEGFVDKAAKERVRNKVIEENNYLAKQVKKYPEKISGFYGIDPLNSFAIEEINRCQNELGLTGLKLHFEASYIELNKTDHLSKVKKVFEHVSSHSIPVLLHLHNGEDDFGELDTKVFIDSILNQIPPMNLYISHLGGAGGFNHSTQEVLKTFIHAINKGENLIKHNLYFDISNVALTESGDEISALSNKDFKTISDLIREVGIEKIVFGTDYPKFRSEEYIEILRENLFLSEEEMDQVLFRNHSF